MHMHIPTGVARLARTLTAIVVITLLTTASTAGPPPICADCQQTPDGTVTVLDLLALLGQWGNTGSCDLNGDNLVDVLDLLALLGQWEIPCGGDPTGACCLPNGNCEIRTEADCTGGANYLGDGTTCEPGVCDAPTGACCVKVDDCQVISQVECDAAGGEYFGDGSECAPNLCTPTGACCTDPITCETLTEEDCALAGGNYFGDDSDCADIDCDSGACCVDLTCSILSEAACLEAGGVYQGDNTDCLPNPCLTVGACCFDLVTCDILDETDCIDTGGTYQGDGVACDPGTCDPANNPPNDHCDGGIVVKNGTHPIDFSTATNSDPDPLCTGDREDLWFNYTATTDGTLRIFSNTAPAFVEVYSTHDCPPGPIVDCAPLEFGVVIPFVTAGDLFKIRIINVDCDIKTPCDFTIETGDTGACCIPFGGEGKGGFMCQDDTTQVQCEQELGGTFQGIGTQCKLIMCVADCGDPASGDCYVTGPPACDNEECCNLVCAIDPFCCEVAWDSICVDEALQLCVGACCLPAPTVPGDCVDAVTPDVCVLKFGGTFQGFGTQCIDNPCVPLGACCFFASPLAGGPTCMELTQDECAAQGGQYEGDAVLCADITCEPRGACCLNDGSCEDGLTLIECEKGLGGLYQGNFTNCIDVDCTPTGACCIFFEGKGGPTCIETTEIDCVKGQGGIYQGDFTTCINVDCSLGACCVDGFCKELSPAGCDVVDGVFQGIGTLCADIDCTVGACCTYQFGDGPLCDDNVTQADCEALGSIWAGGGTTCANFDCLIFTGACCVSSKGNFCVSDLTQDECEVNFNGDYLGNGSSCAGVDCNIQGACCSEADGLPTCDFVNESVCNALGGIYQGDFVGCGTGIDCSLGACCIGDTCSILSEFNCIKSGGFFLGFGSSCFEVDCFSPDCGNPKSGDCFIANGTPGCDDGTCCILVCEIDPFCCSVQWDSLCANEAFDLCNPGTGACCLPNFSCFVVNGTECDELGGNYLGDGVDCFNCPD